MSAYDPYFDPKLYSPRDIRLRIADRARRLRITHSLKQSELAKAAGIAQATVSRFEKTGLIGFDALVNIALALGAEEGLTHLFDTTAPRGIDEIVSSAPRAPVRRVRR